MITDFAVAGTQITSCLSLLMSYSITTQVDIRSSHIWTKTKTKTKLQACYIITPPPPSEALAAALQLPLTARH